jgi:hypothetical protein
VTTVDLSLPTNEQLLASASPNPEVEAAKVTGGDPDRVSEIGARLQRAGSELDRVHQDSTRTQQMLAGSFTIGRYETVLDDSRRLLGELGLSDVLSGGRTGFPGPRLEGEVLGNTAPAPADPPSNIFPVPPRPVREPGFTPAPGGFGPLITLPAPDLGTGVQEGPGSG